MSAVEMTLLKERANLVLQNNLKTAFDPYYNHSYKYVCPSPVNHPWQWFWDSCFHAIALSHLDIELSKNELYNLLVTQENDGFIGHMIFWKGAGRLSPWSLLQSRLALRPHHTALIQPPMLAQAVSKVYERSGDEGFLRELFPYLARYYRWLAENRDPDGDGLISLVSNYESGLDYLPVYDEVLGIRGTVRPTRWRLRRKGRGLDLSNFLLGRSYNLQRIFALDRFHVEDVMVNCIYSEALHTMADLADRVDCPADSNYFSELAEKVEKAILAKCYDAETRTFFSLYGQQERKSRVLTIASLFPLILKGVPRDHLHQLVSHLQDPQEFWLPYPVPSVSKSESSFEPIATSRSAMWRGPTWINTNWFLVRGLRRHGYDEIADVIVQRSLELVMREGFREFYDPFTGKGMGARDFAWSTVVLDMVE